MMLEEAAKLAADLLIKPFEGCRLRAYMCPAGIWTCGWGETQGVTADTVWTQEEADARLERRVRAFMLGVLDRCPALYMFGPEMLAACTSLAYNIGLGAFKASSVCRLTMRGECQRAANSFLLWNKARVGGVLKPLRGLTRRRQAERDLYLSGA